MEVPEDIRAKDDIETEENNWAQLPPHVIEKIVLHTVKGSRRAHESTDNWFAARVRKCALVHPLWKSAILFSHSIFHQKKAFPVDWPPEKTIHIHLTSHDDPKCDVLPDDLIKEEYLQSVQWLDLLIHREDDLKQITESLVARNSIQGILLETNHLSENLFHQFCEVIKLMKKATDFHVRIPVRTQAEAKRLWKLMRMAVQANNRTKVINFEYALCKSRSAIDWSFVNQDERVGTVSQFYLRGLVPSTGFLSHLADIETLTIHRLDQLWSSDGAYLDQTEAKCLQICVRPSRTLLYSLQLLEQLNNVAIKRKVKVKTVEVIILGDDIKTIKYRNTFDCDALLWKNFKDHFLPVYKVRKS